MMAKGVTSDGAALPFTLDEGVPIWPQAETSKRAHVIVGRERRWRMGDRRWLRSIVSMRPCSGLPV